ncbi:MAG: DNA polymerase III subunit beta [Candidatus Omnitrophica bacterium]|nr:DNA polymerase III subunit beta [Candidatus Omnitrophota bacterium]
MKIRCEKDILLKGVQTVQNIISTRTALPILSNILLETQKKKLYLAGTDLDVGITTQIDVEIEEEGAITLPAKRFGDVIKELPEEECVLSTKKNNMVTIECGKCFFRLPGLSKDDFPKFPTFENELKYLLPQETLRTMLRMTSFAMSHDETRYVLNGILFEIGERSLTLVATDGRRLAYIEKALETIWKQPYGMIVPTKTIHELNRLLQEEGEIKIVKKENQVLFDLGETSIISRLIDGEFPNYKQVIPKEGREKIRINREQFLQAARRASLLTSQESQSIKLDLLKDKVVVSKTSAEVGEAREEIEAEYKGRELTIGFNPTYIIDGLKNISEADVAFELEGPEKPGVIRTKDNYIYIVLPMQISS